jgi:cell division protease FtsH
MSCDWFLQVLVVAATNRPEVLDPALVRPGRFDRTIYMGRPNADSRYSILCVHARGKQIPRGDDDELLRQAAKRSAGFSGAELANLLNEAAILQARFRS